MPSRSVPSSKRARRRDGGGAPPAGRADMEPAAAVETAGEPAPASRHDGGGAPPAGWADMERAAVQAAADPHGARQRASAPAPDGARAPPQRPTASGLDGVLAAETALSDVDGEGGHLTLRGHAVEEIAPRATFEDACALFLGGTSADARVRLGDARARAHRLHVDGDAMERLRVHLAQPGAEAPWDAIGLLPVALAPEGARPDPSVSHARDLLRMLRSVAPTDDEVRALDTYLVTVIDHGMNASTFAARVVASTGSDLRSCLTAGIGALKGPLHGGAPGPVLDMLDAVREPARARSWIEAKLDAGEKIMGMGHRIYRVRDPRAFVLERAIERLGRSPRLELARIVEREAEAALARRHPERALKANVEFFTAVLLEAVGIDRTLFSSVFACSRVVGWCAHVGEQRQFGKLIRPASRYVGPRVRQEEEATTTTSSSLR